MSSNAYMRAYMLNKYRTRRKEAITLLGGCCKVCGRVKNLEMDHIDPCQKSFELAKLWSCKRELYLLELKKCQLLCKKCHIEKTLVDKNQISARRTHGTLSSYRYCKCAFCKAAKNKYTRKWRDDRRKRDNAPVVKRQTQNP